MMASVQLRTCVMAVFEMDSVVRFILQDEEEEMCDLLSLPDEILLHMMSFLDPKSVVNMVKVNKTLNGLGNDDDLWKSLTINHFNLKSDSWDPKKSWKALFLHLQEVLADDVFIWGDGGCHRLGLGRDDTIYSPEKLTIFNQMEKKIAQVCCGWFYTLVLTADGEIYTMGDNVVTEKREPVPKLIEDFEGAKMVALSANTGNAAAIDVDGNAWVWGELDYNRRGAQRCRPTKMQFFIDNGLTIKSLACCEKRNSVFFVTENGLLYSMGVPCIAQNMMQHHEQGYPLPQLLMDSGEVAGVFAGQSAVIVILKSGRALFGVIASGELNFKPIPNSERYHFERAAVGVSEDCKFLLDKEGQLFQILISDGVPHGIKLILDNVRDIAAGNAHAVAVTKDGKVFSWGDPYQGELGLGRAVCEEDSCFIRTPEQISSLRGRFAKQVSCGYFHTSVIVV